MDNVCTSFGSGILVQNLLFSGEIHKLPPKFPRAAGAGVISSAEILGWGSVFFQGACDLWFHYSGGLILFEPTK